MRTKAENERISLDKKFNSISYYWQKKLVQSILPTVISDYRTWFYRLRNSPLNFHTSTQDLKNKLDTIIKGIKDRKSKTKSGRS